MGGGDREKKWKVEEMDKSERRRLKELLKERLKERPEEEAEVTGRGKNPLDWMYKEPGNQVNSEDYLMGKEVDKAFMDAQDGQKDAARAQGGIASAGSVFGSSANSALDAKDMARKMREDPLFAIKKRELNSRKELVSNPIRMKQLQQMLQSQVGKDKKKSKKKHKEKKAKKQKRSRVAPSESSSEEDRRSRRPGARPPLPGASQERRTQGHPRQGRGRDRSPSYSSSSSSDSDGPDPRHRGGSRDLASLNTAKMKALLECEMLKKMKKKQHRPRESSSSSGSSSDDERSRKRPKKHSDDRQRGRQLESEQQRRFKSHPDQSDSHKRQKNRSGSPPERRRRDDSEQPRTQKSYGLTRGGRSSHRSRTPSPTRMSGGHRHERSGSDSPPRRKAGHSREDPDRRKDARSLKAERHGSRGSDGRTEKRRLREESRSPSPVRQHSRAQVRSRSRSPTRQNGSQRQATAKRKLTAEEMERKRAEMMDNAKWRDDQRRERVKEYQREEEAEAEMEKKKSRNAEFVQPLKLPDNSSVEDRIHRKIHSIQRTKAALDKNFAKR